MSKKMMLAKQHDKNIPILLKIAPDLSIKEQEEISQLSLKHQIDGLIISNTTISRNDSLQSSNAQQDGGLSGCPLFNQSNIVLKNIYNFTEKSIPIIGVGGISSADDAYEKIKLGASLVQIYSSLIYQGFGVVEKIKWDLNNLVEKDGLNCIKDAVGINCNV
jgi:dihydroorotate dehydrogenase